MTNTRIAVIGMGQIGRRHLQALTRIDRPIHIQVVDPSPSALQQARKAYHDMKPPRYPQHVEYFSRLDSLSPHLHLAIIATTAEVRKATVEQLLRLKNVHRLILEKVVFQYPDDFVNINKVLQEKNVKTWVNCPLRIYPFFQELKKNIKCQTKEPAPINYFLSGCQFNLASNTIHHLDLFSYLTETTQVTLDESLLSKQVLPNKRKGFMEFTGTLQGSTNAGDRITLTSYPSGASPLLLHVNNNHVRCIAKFNENKAWVSYSPTWSWKEVDFHVPYQSNLTHLVAQQILDEDYCKLPTYSTSWQLHLPLLHSLTRHLHSTGNWSEKRCPIT